MSKNLINKRGEMSSQMIVSLVLLLVGFVIILSILPGLFSGINKDREVCHQSVLLRATTQIDSLGMGGLSLNCKTQKYCLTSKGVIQGLISRSGEDSCDSVFKGSKEVKNIKVETKKDIEKFISEQVIDCWLMMGEGKLSLFTPSIAERLGFKTVSSSCIICSRIAFSENLDISEEELKNIDVYGYMRENKISGRDISYSDYFRESEKQLLSEITFKYPEDEKNEINFAESSKIITEDLIVEEEKSIPEDLAIVFMQVSAPSGEDSVRAWAGVGGAGAVGLFSPGGKTVGKIIGRFCLAAKPLCAAIVSVVAINSYLNIKESRNIAAGYCVDSFQGAKGSTREGCSVVRVIDYDAGEVRNYCGVIESY